MGLAHLYTYTLATCTHDVMSVRTTITTMCGANYNRFDQINKYNRRRGEKAEMPLVCQCTFNVNMAQYECYHVWKAYRRNRSNLEP